MKRAFFLGNKAFEVRAVELSALKSAEIRIKNMASGVCGSDSAGHPGARVFERSGGGQAVQITANTIVRID